MIKCPCLTKKGKPCPINADRIHDGKPICHVHDPNGLSAINAQRVKQGLPPRPRPDRQSDLSTQGLPKPPQSQQTPPKGNTDLTAITTAIRLLAEKVESLERRMREMEEK